jgi:hypothetical protein
MSPSDDPHAAGQGLRDKFAGGALESASHILGSASAGIFAVGLIGPYIAALDEPPGMSPRTILSAAVIALSFSVLAGVGAIVLRGLGRCAGHFPAKPNTPLGSSGMEAIDQ